MSDSIFDQIQTAAEYLRLELTSQEMANLSVEQELGEKDI